MYWRWAFNRGLVFIKKLKKFKYLFLTYLYFHHKFITNFQKIVYSTSILSSLLLSSSNKSKSVMLLLFLNPWGKWIFVEAIIRNKEESLKAQSLSLFPCKLLD